MTINGINMIGKELDEVFHILILFGQDLKIDIFDDNKTWNILHMLTGATHKRVFLCPYSICKMLQSPHAKICKVISCYCTTRGSMLMRHNTLHLLMQSICPQPGPKCTCAYPQPAIMLATLFIFLCHQPSVLPYCTHSYVPELPFYQCLINPL